MLKTSLYVLGGVLVLVGLLGFVNDPVLGIFEVNTLHNLVHIVTGLILLWLGYAGGSTAVLGAKVFGVVYLLVAVLGFLSGDMILGLIEVNMADHILHLLLAAVFLYLGFGLGKKESGNASAVSPGPQNQAPMDSGNTMPPQQ